MVETASCTTPVRASNTRASGSSAGLQARRLRETPGAAGSTRITYDPEASGGTVTDRAASVASVTGNCRSPTNTRSTASISVPRIVTSVVASGSTIRGETSSGSATRSTGSEDASPSNTSAESVSDSRRSGKSAASATDPSSSVRSVLLSIALRAGSSAALHATSMQREHRAPQKTLRRIIQPHLRPSSMG